MSDGPYSVESHYDALADIWAGITQGPEKQRLLWPAVRSLLPTVEGERVLDVGCGNGYYSAWLADRGAEVLGIDISQEMVRSARKQHGDRAEFRRVDIEEALAFADDDQFGLVLCQHVFSHLPALEPTLGEFARVLRPGGTVIVSTHHPFHDFLVVREQEYPDTNETDGMDYNPVVVPANDTSNYDDTERYEIHWNGPDSSNPGVYYRRPLNEVLGPLLGAGFELRELLEPTPDEDFERDFPEIVREMRQHPPRSICLRAQR